MQRFIGPSIYLSAIAGAILICAACQKAGAVWIAFPLVYLFGLLVNLLMAAGWPTQQSRESWADFRESLVIAAAAFGVNQLFFGPWTHLFSGVFNQSIFPDFYPQFIQGLPAWLAVLVIIIISEGIGYLIHRWKHHNKWLWARSHSPHHEPKGFGGALLLRISHIDFLIDTVIRVSVVNLLQFDQYLIAVAMTLGLLVGALSHSNTALKFGWLSEIFVTADFHLWHHVPDRQVNFSFGLLNIFDRLGGTFFCPGYRPDQLGVNGISRVRTGWEVVLMRPLQLETPDGQQLQDRRP
ncbi:MAG: sterol desaturase family protein [Ramlibacter sp.]|uniref:sterol desaturase family protein n=1 Tax=Ramlibacter sp. TaxID=1917967 RepID=UPI002607567C|nr:sterol desaturase family protein [Ramlibacter sp.]MDH4374698.1 sterol desaturase family protein [Ramlibacter sp.]